MELFWPYIKVFLISMVPVLELRAAIPLGVASELPLWPVIIVSVLGNLFPVPFILLFLKQVFAFLEKHSKRGAKLVAWLNDRAAKKGEKLYKSEVFGLFLLVAIPLPGTGAWTGALVARVFDIRAKVAVPAIAAGVLAAAVITSLITYGAAALF